MPPDTKTGLQIPELVSYNKDTSKIVPPNPRIEQLKLKIVQSSFKIVPPKMRIVLLNPKIIISNPKTESPNLIIAPNPKVGTKF